MLVLDPSSAAAPFEDRNILGGDTFAGDDTITDSPSLPVENDSETAGFDFIFQELASLLELQDEEEVPPTFYALHRMYGLLKKIYEVMHRKYLVAQDAKWKFPKGFVATDEFGGLRIEWWHERTHCVTLAVGHDAQAPTYVFIKKGSGEKGTLYRHAFPAWLASRLSELNEMRALQG